MLKTYNPLLVIQPPELDRNESRVSAPRPLLVATPGGARKPQQESDHEASVAIAEPYHDEQLANSIHHSATTIRRPALASPRLIDQSARASCSVCRTVGCSSAPMELRPGLLR
ncbi:hypothetical protein KC19_1G070700 [Ceratodon purpureus]|uniref:Uncharacterized protein n=1 Tax=Ceratodon purpureus TaxID=3225 RepID=A0A8T0J3E5_CERPU|nr:hypothetical protein KC19_1G070700 [Ceratodon purpureus]